MPAAIAIPAIATAIASGTAAVASVHGANVQGRAAKDASAVSERSNAAAIEEQKRQDAQAKAEFDAQQKLLADQWTQKERLKEPYRQASRAALLHLNDLLGFNVSDGGMAAPSAPTTAVTRPMGSLITPSATKPMTPEPMVTLLAPNGQRGQVPASQADHYLSKGARRVA